CQYTMKKCSNPKCGLEGIGRFCHQCGEKMIDPPTDLLLTSIYNICDGKDKSVIVGKRLKSSCVKFRHLILISVGDVKPRFHRKNIFALSVDLRSNQYQSKHNTFSAREREFIHLDCTEVEEFNTSMKGCLTNIAVKARDGGYIIEYWHSGLTEKERFRYLLSDLFRRQWQVDVANGPQEAEYIRIIKMAISWPPIQLFIRNQNENTGISLLMEDCKENLLIATKMLERHWETLETGKIEIGILQMISNHSEGFTETLALIRPNESSLKRKVLSTIKIRMLELESFKNQSSQMTVFVNLCEHLKSVDTRAIDKVLQKTLELEKHSLMEFCKPKAMKDSEGTSGPDLRAFDVEPTVLDILPKLERLTEGHVFMKIWTDTCLGTTEGCETPLDVVNVVWKPAFESILKETSNFEILTKTGQKEFKVFIDLAMISAGQEPLSIAKVQCLHSAVLGYSPLIFDLDETDCDYIRLLDMCKVVWKELAANPNLPKQLLDTSRELEWLKEIKKAHGSVEVTSLMQAEAINADGIYTVGKGAWKGSEMSDMMVKDLIKLTVPGKDGQRQQKHYTFDQLQDLQSRLMLVAGKSDSSTAKSTDKKSEVNVDRFTMGRKSDVEGLEDMVPKIADFMENCYGEWLDLIKQKRKIYRYLNFFTIDQLVILQRELVKMGTEEEPSLRIYHLLHAVKENCVQEDVVLAMGKAKRELSVMEDGPDKTSVEIHDQEEIGDQTEEKISQFIHELVEAGYDEELARKSVDHVKHEDIDDCDVTEALIWCMYQKGEENDGVEMNQDDDEYTEDVGPRFSGWSNSTTSISSLIKRSVTSVGHKANIGVKPLINDLKELWKNFLGSISSNISDYLSLEHLGVILNMLAERDEVLRVALSIYMYDPDQPLPQSDEVLVCTSETSADEVCIFWRRAIYDRSGKIHCLLHADQLDFDVSEAAEQCLEELLYQVSLVRDMRIRQRISFDDCFVFGKVYAACWPGQWTPIEGICDASSGGSGISWQTLCSHGGFQKVSTVRIIKSTRAGVGKTLFVHRKDEAVQVQIQRKTKLVDTQKVSIPLQEKVINLHCFIQRLLEHTPDPRKQSARIFHLNMNHEVQEGVDYVLFNLLILNCLVDKSGYVWRRSVHDLYLIEAMPIMTQATDAKEEPHFIHPVFTLFPDSTCRSPDESLQIYSDRNSVQDFMPSDQLFDEQQFRSPVFQRTFQYLLRLDQRKSLESVRPSEPEGDPKTCLNVLLKHCGVRDPSWSELHHFVWFLNTQLVDFEQNQFVSVAAAEDLPGFATFVLRFLIQMSRDFSTRSLNISEETPGMNIQDAMDTEDEDQLELYQMRRTWESSPHPYLFFNSDRFTFTFLGFYIDRNTGNLVDQQTNRILEQGIMAQNLCDIPVIIMGETGCGKTRLIKFMCELQSPPGVDVKNMILMKVHGGTTNEDIKRKVNEAENAARVNIENYGRHMYTVLFFDEANTTEAIGLIKEIMCDKSIAGKRLALCENLKIVAACNPYRKHSDELIKKLEQAGLGYHVDADETTDRLGRVPMRRLVYRVQPLPQSLLPLVWDFGQLNTNVEELYIRQMVRRYINDDRLPAIPNLIEVVSRILTVSQDYMRAQRDECSFVSLRDVERVLTVMAWFYYQGEDGGWLFEEMDGKVSGSEEHRQDDSDEEEETEDEERYLSQELDNITRSLILALGVCYHACLKTRQEYRQAVAGHFRQPCSLQGGEAQILEEIERCQEVFLDNVSLEDNIARNTALKENVFMMVVCIELRIPLFLVGKPGSSKSLAKTIVSDAMQGNSAKHDLFRLLKQVQMVSFQCSPLSTPDGIVGTFRQCAQFQKDKDLQTFVSAVVLDEVAFIGISNWALDPAKMNRGILVQREVPDLEELQNSARGICGSSKDLGNLMDSLIEPLSISYLEVFAQATQKMRDFFGLRDFYSLVKMVYSFVEKSNQPPTWYEMLHAIRRNFGGLDEVNPEEIFRRHLARVISCSTKIHRARDPDCSPDGLIRACLFDTHKTRSSYFKLRAMRNDQLQSLGAASGVIKNIHRNINKIKVCMETGNTVVLLNLDNLYESLYDALNQYYVYFGGERYVDLGLGTHRVKCPVHKKFRLIVVAEKQTVYKKFPIPLINRLEKHFLTVNTILKDREQQLVLQLEKWASDFACQNDGNSFTQRNTKRKMKVGDVFIGFHKDTCSAIIMDVSQKYPDKQERELLEAGKLLLLWCATPESVVRQNTLDEFQQKRFQKYYHERQAHSSLISYLQMKLKKDDSEHIFAQVTTHSKLLASVHKQDISLELGIDVDRIILLETLSSFDTEQQFTNRVQQHLQTAGTGESLMLVQCDSGDVHANLIVCARYIVMDEYEKAREYLRAPVHAIFIVQLPRKAGGCFTGFQCGRWHSAHIDDLCPESTQMPDIQDLQGKTVSGIFYSVVRKHSPPSDIDEELREEMDLTENGANGTQQIDIYTRTSDGANEGVDVVDINVEFNRPIVAVNKDVADHQRQAVLKSALAMVKDKEDYTQRETQRVDIILKCLRHDIRSEQGLDTFLTGLQRLIGQLLKEKEEKTGGDYIAQLWMTREAAAAENINKAGTFRRSCLQTIISKVSPILAGIIAYLDTNRNLDLIHSDVGWKQMLWTSVLNTEGAIQLQFSDLQSPKRCSDLDEMLVMTTGREGHMFSACVPFSWTMIRMIGDILHDILPSDEAFCAKIVAARPMGKILNELVDGIQEGNVEQKHATVFEIVEEYIQDFVHMMYYPRREDEFKLVCQTVHYKTMEICEATNSMGCLIAILTIVHVAYDILALRLAYFRSMNGVWPQCSSVILEVKKTNPDHFMFKERESNWGRVIVMKLFIEHVCKKDGREAITIKYCMPLWKILGKEVDMKEQKSLEGVEKFLKACNQNALKTFNGAEIKCCSCEQKLEGPPVTLPCKDKDVLCDACLGEMKALDQYVCPKCHENLGQDWQPLQMEGNSKEREQLIQYQRRCNAFFMDVVAQLCFSDGQPPSKNVLKKLLGYVTCSARHSQLRFTKNMTIFETGLDPNPVFRSFLLQLMLKSSEEEFVKESLEGYIEQAQSFFREEPTLQQNLVDLSLLIVQCLEHLCRCYGIDVYQSICRHRTTLLRWIVIEELERDQTQEVSDRYVVCGNGYVEIREALSQAMLGEDISILEEKVQELHTTGGRVDTYLQLAVHREITCSYVRSIEKRTATPKSLQMIATFLESTQSQKIKPILRLMMNNTLEPRDFMIAQGSDTRRQGVQCLIIHFMTVLSPLNGARTILHLFLAMIQGDPAIRGMFLPTMPHDDFTEIQEAMLANRGGENPVFYRCPNGHPYVIGNCGRPAVVGKCKECGADIGGQGYQAMPGNVLHTGGDNTIRGHILGRAVPNAPLRPERELSALHCCVIRLLLHMSMFIGPPQHMVPIVRPDVAEDNIRHFFWEHIETSIGDLQRALGRSVDDVLLLMHCVIQNIMVKHNEETTVGGDIAHLQTKRGRQAWEKQFATTDNQQQAEDPQRLEKIPRVWRYRTLISIEHMRQDLETRSTSGKDRLSVLRLFLKQDHILQAIQYIPSILSLQRILLQKFQKKLDKAEANTILVKDMIKEQHAGPDTEKWLQDFAQAWNITRKLLELYVCTTEFGSIVIPKHQCVEPVSMETPLSVFLPSSTETGLCSYAMLDLLFRKQNEFLDSYMKESGRNRNSIQTVAPMEATSADLISYNHEQDILPLVLANCQYTFEMGKGTKIEYDFAGLERQIMDRFLFSKSRIDIGYYLQQTLGLAVKTQISEEIKRLPDLCRFLDNLDIAISFLKTAGGQQSDNLNTFMVDTLQMEHAMTSQKEVFETLLEPYHDELSEELQKSFGGYMKTLSVDKLSGILEILHEFMLLRIARRENTSDEDYIDNTENRLGEELLAFVELMETPCLDTAVLAEFPKEIHFKHCDSITSCVIEMYFRFCPQQKPEFKAFNVMFALENLFEEVFESLLEQYHEELSEELKKSLSGYMKTLSVDKLSGILEILHEFLLIRIARRENASDEDYIDTTENRLGEQLLTYVELMETPCLDTAVLVEFPQEIHFKHS
ncbi:RN213-like protein, partial [Mya arenaria]